MPPHAARAADAARPAAAGSGPPAAPSLPGVFRAPSPRFDLRAQRPEYIDQVEERLRAAKAEVRTDVSAAAWAALGLAYEQALGARAAADAERAAAERGCAPPRVGGDMLTQGDFAERFERPRRPCVLVGLADKWPARAQGRWTLEALREEYAEERLKVGEDDEGYPVRLKLKYFLYYLFDAAVHQRDDAPLYLFDSTFGEDERKTRSLLDDFCVPPHFAEDLFQYAGERRRPPYRWLVVGGPRSGTWCHVDPLATSAWNTVLSGSKRWVLLPPETPKELVDPKGAGDDAATWFSTVLPRVARAADEGRCARPLDFIQRQGETVFVPDGWWHAVINLEPTVAITQNFCSTENFRRCWRESLHGRQGMARKWLRRLRKVRPDLAAIADEESKTVVLKPRRRKGKKHKKDDKTHSHKHDASHDRDEKRARQHSPQR